MRQEQIGRRVGFESTCLFCVGDVFCHCKKMLNMNEGCNDACAVITSIFEIQIRL